MRPKLVLKFILLLLVASCAPADVPKSKTEIVSVYATPSTQPWLVDVFACAPAETIIRVVDDLASADISLRLGEPGFWPASVYQIDKEDIVVVVNNARPLSELSLEQVGKLFTGQIQDWNDINPVWGEVHSSKSGEVHVWVYASGEDIQQIFTLLVLEGMPITSLAQLAVSPQNMHDEVANDESAIGFIPQQWYTTSVFEEAVIPDVPVLALVDEEPQGTIQEIIACIQK